MLFPSCDGYCDRHFRFVYIYIPPLKSQNGLKSKCVVFTLLGFLGGWGIGDKLLEKQFRSFFVSRLQVVSAGSNTSGTMRRPSRTTRRIVHIFAHLMYHPPNPVCSYRVWSLKRNSNTKKKLPSPNPSLFIVCWYDTISFSLFARAISWVPCWVSAHSETGPRSCQPLPWRARIWKRFSTRAFELQPTWPFREITTRYAALGSWSSVGPGVTSCRCCCCCCCCCCCWLLLTSLHSSYPVVVVFGYTNITFSPLPPKAVF